MPKQANPLDRSAAFTVLLELSPQGFGKTEWHAGEDLVTTFLEDWRESDAKDMFAFGQTWLAGIEIDPDTGSRTSPTAAEPGPAPVRWDGAAKAVPGLNPTNAAWWQQQPGEAEQTWRERTQAVASDIQAAIRNQAGDPAAAVREPEPDLEIGS